jgi:putative SOS response-associated peptidase YedK
MCGRYKLSRRKQIVEEYFDTAVSDDPEWNPRFNVAPTQPVPVIRQNLKEPIRELSLMRWGLIPRWAKDPSASAKFCFEVNDGQLFAFAGLWDRWKDATGKSVETCSILTTTPNAVTAAVHDRMPVILDPDAYGVWLDPWMKDVSAASELLKPFDARLMRCFPVSNRVNHVANDDEECSAPVELAETQKPLFS